MDHALLDHVGRKLGVQITRCDPVGRGEHNENYRLNDAYLLRVYANTHFANAENEYRMLAHAPPGTAPRPLLIDTSRTLLPYDWIVEEFVDGEPITATPDQLRACARLLRRVHSVTGTKERKPYSERHDHFHRLAAAHGLALPSILAHYEQVAPLTACTLIHDDPVLSNFRQGTELVLLDWEFATYDHFAKDLGIFIGENRLDEHEALIVDAYGWGAAPDEKRLIHFYKEDRILASIEWLLHRLTAIENGETIAAWQDKEAYERQLQRDTDYLFQLVSQWDTL